MGDFSADRYSFYVFLRDQSLEESANATPTPYINFEVETPRQERNWGAMSVFNSRAVYLLADDAVGPTSKIHPAYYITFKMRLADETQRPQVTEQMLETCEPLTPENGVIKSEHKVNSVPITSSQRIEILAAMIISDMIAFNTR